MDILKFENVPFTGMRLGGKGYVLGQLTQNGFPVPQGVILTSLPKSERDWRDVFCWWEEIGCPKIAVRSSAFGEDSEEHSFAGQNTTFLNVDSKMLIKNAVLNCFNSVLGETSQSYRHFFKKIGLKKIR